MLLAQHKPLTYLSVWLVLIQEVDLLESKLTIHSPLAETRVYKKKKKKKQRTKVSFMVWRKCSANSLVKRDVKTFACISCQLAACGNHTQRHNVLRKIIKLNPDYKKVKRPQRPKRRNISCYG